VPEGWEWDETLYLGSAEHYLRGRFPYSSQMAPEIARRLSLTGNERLIDIGCGPGNVILPLAPLFHAAVGVDPDAGMLATAAREAMRLGITNVSWHRARAEELTAEIGQFQVATFGQSFHWMDRSRVAEIVHELLTPGGWFVHVNERKDFLTATASGPAPPPPYQAIRELVSSYLGPVPRAGQGTLRFGTPSGEDDVLTAAGFAPVEWLTVSGDGDVSRTASEVASWCFAQAGSAPHLFGERLGQFEADLQAVLMRASPTAEFTETLPPTEIRFFARR
jgi:SAM-dependent methyltransferase